jgi:hypothetical protein
MTTSAPSTLLAVEYAPDARPFTRALARVLSLNGLSDEGTARLAEFRGTVVLQSATDPQAASIVSDDEGLRVFDGRVADPGVTLSVHPTSPATPLGAVPADAHDLASTIAALLSPPLPDWPDLTGQFWEDVRSLPAMPSLTLVETGTDRKVTLDGGTGSYEVHGDSDALTRFLAGLEFFADSVYAGNLLIRGTFSQFSVVAGASMKVMWNV